jgi:hypothetical protein
MAIHPLVLMNRAGGSQTGFDESNPYHRIILAKNLFSQQAKKGRTCGNLSDIKCIIDNGGKNEIKKKLSICIC